MESLMTKLKFILHYFLLNKYSYLFAIVCIFSVNWLQVEIPHYIKNAIDLLGQEGASVHRDIQTNVLVVMVFSLIMVVVRILSRMYALNPGRFVEAKLKSDLFYRLNRLPASVHSQYPSGKLISILNNDLTGIRAFFGIGFLQLTNAFFALSLTPIWMWRLSPSLTLYSIIPLVVAFVVFREGFIRMRKYHRERLKRLQDLSEQLMNVLSGMDLIKNQQMGPWVSDEVNRVNRSLQDVYMKVTRIQTFVLPVLNYGNELMKVIILCLGGYFILQQNMTLGEITAFLSYSTLLAFPMMQLGRMAVVYQMGMVSIDSVQSVLSHQIPATDAESAKSVPVQPQALHVKDLSYCYDGQSEPALSRVSFTIQPGQKIGILGSIGSGKSTLVDCINHHLEIEEGQIFWGEQDVALLPRQQWRQSIRTITQEPHLFSDTIEANIRFGTADQSIDKSEVERVLELSQLKEDVSRFAKGDQTLVGEKGIMLSGGQKQRLSIARALLTSSDLLIMDNVLSAVDYETERKILAGLFQQIQSQSVLVVSHRISALESMDEILVMQQGRIIARGTHQSLLETCDYYRETWQLQQHSTEVKA
jgi:ATP-binding cassette, subfamily B, multidrug efflux pump